MLQVKAVSKRLGGKDVLNGVDLKLDTGEIGVLLGASGSGKTTLLRIISGFERADQGEVWLDSKPIAPSVHPSQRRIGFLFQNFGLFPHLNAIENISLALRNLRREDKDARVDEMLELCDLKEEAKKMPQQLSGGQQQRLALARALAPRPRLLLMDEPFSNLDPELRARLIHEVRELLKSQGVTSLVVTHQIEEAYDLADRLGILEAGTINQWGTPYELYHKPKTSTVAQYLERTSLVDVRVGDDGEVHLGPHPLGRATSSTVKPGRIMKLLIRPDDIQHDDSSHLKAKVLSKHFRGSWFLYELDLDGHARFYSYVPSHHNHAIGESIGIRFEMDHLICF